MKIKKKYLSYDYLWLYLVAALIVLKLSFSYLSVEHSYWIRHLPSNYDVHNYFNLPMEFSSSLEYLLIPALLIFSLVNFKYLGNFKLTIIIGGVLLLLNFMTSFITKTSMLNAMTYSLKFISPVLLFTGLYAFINKYQFEVKRLTFFIVRLCLLLALIALLFFEISMNRKVEQLPIFFTNIHTHSYIIAMCFIVLGYWIFKRQPTWILFLYLTVTFLFLYIGYGVRTASVVYITFIIATLFAKEHVFKFIWIQLLVFIPIFGLALFMLFDFNYDTFSSGRLTMYSEKIKLLSSYSAPELLFGKGYGADMITTERWWFELKGSHSDFLTYIVENGLLYLLFTMFLIASLTGFKRRINLMYLSLIIGYFLSSLISNGIAVRPLAGYVFAIAAVYLLVDTNETRLNNQSMMK